MPPGRERRPLRRAAVLLALAAAAAPATAQFKGDPARGAALARPCAACHDPPLPRTPDLAGQPEDYTVMQLFLLREGLREAPQMQGMLAKLSDPDFFDLAAYYARRAPVRGDGRPDAELRARGARLSREMGCGSCHLADYRGQKQAPRLAGQREDYLLATMKDYRDNRRTGPDTSMNGILHKVPDADLAALAHYLAHQ
jgi:cytochrome c553